MKRYDRPTLLVSQSSTLEFNATYRCFASESIAHMPAFRVLNRFKNISNVSNRSGLLCAHVQNASALSNDTVRFAFSEERFGDGATSLNANLIVVVSEVCTRATSLTVTSEECIHVRRPRPQTGQPQKNEEGVVSEARIDLKCGTVAFRYLRIICRHSSTFNLTMQAGDEINIKCDKIAQLTLVGAFFSSFDA